LEPEEYLYERHEPRVVEGGGIHGSSIRRPLPPPCCSPIRRPLPPPCCSPIRSPATELGGEGFDAAATTREGKGRGIVFVLGLYYLSRWAKGLWSKSQYGGLDGPDLICRVPEMGFSFFLLFSGRKAKLCSQKKKKRKTFKKIGSKTKKKNKRCH
jgi:hypothetical protein